MSGSRRPPTSVTVRSRPRNSPRGASAAIRSRRRAGRQQRRPAPRDSRCGRNRRARRPSAKRPSLRVSRASRLAVRHGMPGRDNSRSRGLDRDRAVVALHADVAGDARERLGRLGKAQALELRLQPQARDVAVRCRARRRVPSRARPPARRSCPAASPPTARGRDRAHRPGRASRRRRCRRGRRPLRPRRRSPCRGARAIRRGRSAVMSSPLRTISTLAPVSWNRPCRARRSSTSSTASVTAKWPRGRRSSVIGSGLGIWAAAAPIARPCGCGRRP